MPGLRKMKTRENGDYNVSAASSIAAKLAEAASKEFFWGCELSKEKPTITWTFEEEDEDQDFLQHTLFLRHAVLGKDVKSEERNIVQVETKNFAGDDIKQPIASLTRGKTDMCQFDLNFTHEIPVTFRLVEGTGPVFLSAQQVVEFPDEVEEDECLTATETETEPEYDVEDGLEDDDEDLKTKKRKAHSMTKGSKKKRGKLDNSAVTSEEEEEEEDDDDEDGEEEDEDMDTDDEDDDEDEEEEEEEESPKKKTKKKGKPAAKGSAKKAPPPAKAKKGKKGKAK